MPHASNAAAPRSVLSPTDAASATFSPARGPRHRLVAALAAMEPFHRQRRQATRTGAESAALQHVVAIVRPDDEHSAPSTLPFVPSPSAHAVVVRRAAVKRASCCNASAAPNHCRYPPKPIAQAPPMLDASLAASVNRNKARQPFCGRKIPFLLQAGQIHRRRRATRPASASTCAAPTRMAQSAAIGPGAARRSRRPRDYTAADKAAYAR